MLTSLHKCWYFKSKLKFHCSQPIKFMLASHRTPRCLFVKAVEVYTQMNLHSQREKIVIYCVFKAGRKWCTYILLFKNKRFSLSSWSLLTCIKNNCCCRFFFFLFFFFQLGDSNFALPGWIACYNGMARTFSEPDNLM